MKVVLIKDHKLEVLDIESTIEVYKKLIDAEYLDAVKRLVNGYELYFWVDDIGLRNKNKKEDIEALGELTLNSANWQEYLVGSILITGVPKVPPFDQEVALKDYEVEAIKEYFQTMINKIKGKEEDILIYQLS